MHSHALRPGDQFNPSQIFIGSFIPNVLMRFTGLSDGAKLARARLNQYAGHDGICYPALKKWVLKTGPRVKVDVKSPKEAFHAPKEKTFYR